MNGISSKTGERLDDNELEATVSSISGPRQGITWRGDTHFQPGHRSETTLQPLRRHRSFLSMQGVGARPLTSLHAIQQGPSIARRNTDVPPRGRNDINEYFNTATGWIARNSQFHGLSHAEREKLGGYEYRAISFLAWLVPAYFIAWQLLTCICLGAYVHNERRETTEENGLNAHWVGAFNAVSAFNNSGMSLSLQLPLCLC